MAGRLAPDVPRRAGLRLQVEHGLDARHAGLLPAGPGLPALPPPRADVLADVRLQRELHPAAVATTRSCTARARCWTKMPGDRWQQLANLRALYAYMWAHPGKKLLFMGQEFAQEREWSHERSLDWHLLEDPATAACRRWCATSTTSTATTRRCGSATTTTRRSAGWRPTTPTPTCSRSCAGATATPSRSSCICNLSPVPREGYRVGLPRSGAWTRGAQHRRRHLRRLERRQHGRRSRPRRSRGTTSRSRRRVTLPPLGAVWLVPSA